MSLAQSFETMRQALKGDCEDNNFSEEETGRILFICTTSYLAGAIDAYDALIDAAKTGPQALANIESELVAMRKAASSLTKGDDNE